MDRAKADKLRQLVKHPGVLRQIADGISKTVLASLAVDRARAKQAGMPFFSATQDEVRRRADICYRWFVVLRCDLGYGTEHAIDTLALALRAELEGVSFVPPPAHRAWAPART